MPATNESGARRRRVFPIDLNQEPAIPNEPFSNADSLQEQVDLILEQPPMPIDSRELGDAIEITKLRNGPKPEPLAGTPAPPARSYDTLFLSTPRADGSAVCSTPLIMPPSSSVTATFDSDTTKRCIYAPEDSHYYAVGFTIGDGTDPLNFFGFTYNGVHYFGYCLDQSKDAPIGPYSNISMEEAMPGATQAARLAVSFCIGNSPSSPEDYQGGQDFFDWLGANNCPNLNGYDAYGVIQATIWCLLGQGDPSTVQFTSSIYCPTNLPAPKYPCMQAAMEALYNLAFDYGNGVDVCGTGGDGSSGTSGTGSSAAACCNCTSGAGSDPCNDPCGLRLGNQIGTVLCCNTGKAVTDQSSTYLVFVGCANDIRECCGRVLLGPFKLASSNPGTPTITLTPCDGCQGADISFADHCCNTLVDPPTIGEEFYITFRPPCCRYCFDLTATMLTNAIAVYYFKKPNSNVLQPVGAPIPYKETKTATIHICIDITPEAPPPEPEPWWEHVLVNNNNNNNNNDSSNNDNNANNNMLNNMLENLLTNLLSSNMLNSSMLSGGMMNGGMMGLGGFPGMGYPGYSSYPPYPPGPTPPPSPGPCGDGRFPFPWGLFPPGCTPCPSPACGGPNPCCCQQKCCPPPCPSPCCGTPCSPWPEPCFAPPQPYISDPPCNLIIQPASLTYQALPMPVPYFCPPQYPYAQEAPYPPSYGPYPQPYTGYSPYPAPQPSYPPYPWPPNGPGDDAQQAVQQVYSPVTVVVPQQESNPQPYAMPPMPQNDPPPFMCPPPHETWWEYSPAPAPRPVPQQKPMPLLLPEVSSAPHPDYSPFNFEPSQQNDDPYDWNWHS